MALWEGQPSTRRRACFTSWRGGGLGELKPKAARVKAVQWEVWTGTQERRLVRWQGCQTCHCSPWCHCPHWESPPFPAEGGWGEGMGRAEWERRAGCRICVAASAGLRSQFWGGSSEGGPAVAVTEAAAEVAPGAITGPGRRPPELQP